MDYRDEQLREYLQWDIATWKQALAHWDNILSQYCSFAEGHETSDARRLKALDLGARDGGLSLYLAQKDVDVICSDIAGPSDSARELHVRRGVSERISYAKVDATDMPFDDDQFDIVILKSLFAVIGVGNNPEAIRTAIREIHRVLRPKGMMLFAENVAGTALHMKARKLFVPWGRDCYYSTLAELEEMLDIFADSQVQTYGFLSCAKKDFKPFAALDQLICRSPKSPYHYMAFGHATKA
ncbi:MAG: class I SAM-dependent methyltransferase [Coriobacteriales bacterium]|jgi:ubiquinone/menaquinone biosynthesis C-methylase UbiE|nr:class I SAM-dependent methyltransferase [Coriobacteriales bacterium]